MLYRIVYDYNMFNLTNRRKKMLNLKDQYGRPSEFALTVAMEGIKNEIIKIKDKIENDEITGDKKKYLQALFNLNNKLVNEYGKKGGDASGYWLEFEEDKNDPYKIWNFHHFM